MGRRVVRLDRIDSDVEKLACSDLEVVSSSINRTMTVAGSSDSANSTAKTVTLTAASVSARLNGCPGSW